MEDLDVEIMRGITNVISFSNRGNIKAVSDIVFTLKNNNSDTDNNSILQISYLNGLRILNGNLSSDSSTSIEIIDEISGDFRITIGVETSKQLKPVQTRRYDIKSIWNGGKIDLVGKGSMSILPDVTNSI